MCGRYAIFRRDDVIARAFRVQQILGEERAPSWNVAPMQGIRVVLERTPREEPEGDPVRQLRRARECASPIWPHLEWADSSERRNTEGCWRP